MWPKITFDDRVGIYGSFSMDQLIFVWTFFLAILPFGNFVAWSHLERPGNLSLQPWTMNLWTHLSVNISFSAPLPFGMRFPLLSLFLSLIAIIINTHTLTYARTNTKDVGSSFNVTWQAIVLKMAIHSLPVLIAQRFINTFANYTTLLSCVCVWVYIAGTEIVQDSGDKLLSS